MTSLLVHVLGLPVGVRVGPVAASELVAVVLAFDDLDAAGP
jgi:hypothetical protein